MNFRVLQQDRKGDVGNLFAAVFSSSEGEQEGKLIGDLASSLAAHIDNRDIICCVAEHEEVITGAIFFTRLRFDEPVDVFMLAPVAVSTAHQRQGLGQALINFGLGKLKERSVLVAITYGDPAFYSRVGFQPLSESIIQAPLTLSIPEGWLGQSLQDEELPVLTSRPVCVRDFNNPAYW